MPKILIVGTQSFDFPIVGESPDFGESVTDWAEAVSDALTSVQQPNDIQTQSATILNGQLSLADIAGFIFDTSEVITINCEYIVKRNTTSPANNLVESGFIKGNFDGGTWTITREQIGDAAIELSINGAGQIQYTSTAIIGTNYAGQISFKAKVFNET